MLFFVCEHQCDGSDSVDSAANNRILRKTTIEAEDLHAVKRKATQWSLYDSFLAVYDGEEQPFDLRGNLLAYKFGSGRWHNN